MSDDFLQEIWNKQKIEPTVNQSNIFAMLSRKSLNNVKLIVIINLLELLFGLGLSVFSFVNHDENLWKGFKNPNTIEKVFQYSHLMIILNFVFLYLFYTKYKGLKVEQNVLKFIQQLKNFKKIGYSYMIINMILAIIVFVLFYYILLQNHIPNYHHQLTETQYRKGLLLGMLIGVLALIIVMSLYYALLYGIIFRKINKNLKILQELEK